MPGWMSQKYVYVPALVNLTVIGLDFSPGSQGDTPISRWQFQTAYPYYPPHATEQIVATATARFGGGAPSGGPSPASCAPTSSAAAIPPAR